MSAAIAGSAYVDRGEAVEGPTAETAVGDTITGESNGTTVISSQGLIPTVEAPRAAIFEPNGMLISIDESGEVSYINSTYHAYWDVDPVPGRQRSVMYVAAEFIPARECGTKTNCYRRTVEVVNLTDGETRELYSETSSTGRWHDVDRYDNDSIVVADITEDEVTVLNTTSGIVEWSWNANRHFPPSSGGVFGGDWTHINDVELLPDGRIMASLRNQDVVVFLDPETGVVTDWTLGSDDEYDVLFEQHNPDYIPSSGGGPAVIVADSENDRIVEYQRGASGWEESWVWWDRQMNWPRDADRLPNGHTLITDSRSNRVFEIDSDGEKIWSVEIRNPYEAERIGTGDESSGGESAERLGLDGRATDDRRSDSGPSLARLIVPQPLIEAIRFVKPVWADVYHIGAALVAIGTIPVWLVLEVYWSRFRVLVRNPFEVRRT
jgi:hypothetical protein